MARLTRLVPKHLLFTTGTLVAAGAIAAFTFQNCAKVSFESAPESLSSFGEPASKTPQYAQLKAGDDAFLPPLKMIFVVDNSGTMQANQISLGNAFSKLFDGSNGKNLAPFDTTAFVFNTAQRSVTKSADAATYGRLPKLGLDDFGHLSSAEISAGPRAAILDGQVPGDLVGYRVLESSADGLNTVSYLPAPVARFSQERGRTFASALSHKAKDGSISEFAQDFRDRIAVLDPERSAIDPVSRKGVLDAVIDNESGLCALARVMHHKDEFVKPGELAAFIVVTDEDDADPVGKSCIESVSDTRANENLVDGKCVTPKTTIKYRERNANPTAANCTIAHDTGFRYRYEYSVPQTEIQYYLLQRDYKVRRLEIKYPYGTTYVYRQPLLTFSYFTKAPTYKIPQTTITYYKKIETCESYRDGNKINCTYTYPQETTSVIAKPFADCRAFAQGKVPADALLDDAAHPLTCNKLQPIAKTGSCSEADPNIVDCKQNYSASRKTSAAIDGALPASSAACIAFAKDKLEAGAVLDDVGYAVQCNSAGTRNVSGNGVCPNNGFACDQARSTTSTTIDGYLGSSTCFDYAKLQRGRLNQQAILTSASEVSCSEVAGRDVKYENGACASLDANATTACVQHPAATSSREIAGARPSNKTCLQFVKDTIGSRLLFDDSAPVTCTDAAPIVKLSSEKTIAFSNAAVSQYTPVVNADCLPALKNVIQSGDGLTPTKCTVMSIVTSDFSYGTGKTCEQMDIAQKCAGSNNALRNCRNPRSTQPGDEYKSSLTEIAGVVGTFTCESLCKDTNLCPSKSGTVRENYKDCESRVADSERSFTGVPASRAVCTGSENPTPIITKTYQPEVGARVEYVAGARTESNEPNALASYIRERAGSSVQSVSVFVRQQNDPTGSNGSVGRAYNTFVDIMGGGEKKSVLGSADAYASALESLGDVISQKLRRSFAIPLQGDQKVYHVWFRKAGTSAWGEPLAETEYEVTGGTVTVAESFQFNYGDEFRFEYY